jgi:hypothetical protein
VKLLGSQQRKPVGEVEAHLRPEPRQGSGSGPVLLLDSMVENLLHEIEILAHRSVTLTRRSARSKAE